MSGRKLFAVISAVGLLATTGLSAFPAAAQQWSYGPYMMSDMMSGQGWWGMILGPFMMIALLAIVIAVVVLLVRWLGGAQHHQVPHLPPGKTALDILRDRFARGEIDKQEFEDRRRVLGE
ncbi:MAG: SHOCT domain-containing protein [Alphaproteobacteria bacterium]